ncbi:DMT family transporter [Rhodospirillaceae bacterium SYSU D60014]|uniref:DMT family transporter n=1 Tax=Virgifigura deserti TaxID=2268457 RepID=UPI000E66D5CE
MSSTSSAPLGISWQAVTPGLFVFLWSTGFIFAKLGLLYAAPLTFLLLRFVAVTVLMLGVTLAMRAPWPSSWTQIGHIAVVGVLLHALYLGGNYVAMAMGIPAGIAALIAGLQPLLTATVVGPFLGERVSPRQWLGLVLGFTGVALVLWNKLGIDVGTLWGFGFALLSLVGITAATMYQKRYCGAMDMRSGAVIQYAAASLFTATAVAAVGAGEVAWTPEFLFSLSWLVIALSIGAISLLTWLIRRGAASRVASLFYLVPPAVAIESYLIFGETLGPLALLGMAIAVVGVALVIRR